MLRARLLYLAALAACLLLALGFDDGNVGFALLYTLLIFSALSLASWLAAPWALELSQQLERDTAFKNDTVAYSCQIRNRGLFLYPRVVCEMGSAHLAEYGDSTPLVFAMGPRGRRSRQYAVRFPYRGIYPLGVERMVVTDFLGLFRRVIRPKEPLTVTVYPVGDEGFVLALRNEPQNSALSTDPFSEDYTSVADVRKYTDSDSLRKIHWKLSAKRGELMAKNYNAFESDRTVLLLDTRALPLPPVQRAALEDAIISCAASAVDYFMEGRRPAELLYGEDPEDRVSLGQMDEVGDVFRVLAGIAFDGAGSPVESAAQIEGGYNLVAFLTALDEAVHDGLRELIALDHNLILYYFYAPELPLTSEIQYLLESLAAYGAGVHRVDLGPMQPTNH